MKDLYKQIKYLYRLIALLNASVAILALVLMIHIIGG